MFAETASTIEQIVSGRHDEAFIHNLTYQQHQNFALVLVIRRHRDLSASLSAEGNAAAVGTADRCSQSKNFSNARRSIGKKRKEVSP